MIHTPWSDRPAEVDKDQIKILTEKNQHYTTWEIANIPKISKLIKLLVKMKNVSILWEKKIRAFWPTQKKTRSRKKARVISKEK